MGGLTVIIVPSGSELSHVLYFDAQSFLYGIKMNHCGSWFLRASEIAI